MQISDPDVQQFLAQAMVARIATLSSGGKPSVNPLYFIVQEGRIWLGTPEWTLAARNVKAQPQASLLFNIEKSPADPRILGVRGPACVRTEADVMQIYNQRVARKYVLTPGGLRNWLSHPRQLWMRRYYTAASNQKGRAAVIEVIPQEIFWEVQP